MNRFITTSILLLFSLSISAQYFLRRSGSSSWENKHESFKEYNYSFHTDVLVGIKSRGTDIGYVTWSVINGKIKDENGNYSSTTVTKLAETPPRAGATISSVSIMWDIAEKGKIIFYMPSDYYIYGREEPFEYAININPFNGNIYDIDILSERFYKAESLYIKNVNIGKGADVILNGYNSVLITPGFHAELGSTVRIYNGTAPKALTRGGIEDKSMIENEMGIDKYSAKLNQNFPSPAYSITTIPCVIPENRVSAYLQLCNMMGMVVMKIPITSAGQNSIDINTTELANGIYMYSLIVDGRLVDTKRMIISN